MKVITDWMFHKLKLRVKQKSVLTFEYAIFEEGLTT
jgi:hypothetical protein